MMRSSAKGTLHPFADQPTLAVPVLWYKVPLTNPFLELFTCFQWDQWNQVRADETFPGFERAYTWNRGIDAWHFSGASFCGSAEQWAEGCLTTDPVSVDPITGQPTCCGLGLLRWIGGQADGGQVLVSAPQTRGGGQEEGGSVAGQSLFRAAGGQEEGGEGWYSASVSFFGGQEEGGSVAGSTLFRAAGGQEEGGSASYNASRTLAGGQEEGGEAYLVGGSREAGGQEEGGSATLAGGAVEAGGQEEGGSATTAGGAVQAGGQEEGGSATLAGGAVEAGGQEEGGSATTAGGAVQAGGQEEGGSAQASPFTEPAAAGGQEEGGSATADLSGDVITATQYAGTTVNAKVLVFELSNPNGVHGNCHIQNTHATFSLNFWWEHTDMDGGVSTYNTNVGPNGFLEIDFTAGSVQFQSRDGWIPFKDVKVFVGDFTAGSHASYNCWVSWIH